MEGALYGPPLPFFLPVTQNYHEALITENSWSCKPFLLRMPLWKKIKKFSLTPLSEHYGAIWVWKPVMGERVKGIRLPHRTWVCWRPRWPSSDESSSLSKDSRVFRSLNICAHERREESMAQFDNGYGHRPNRAINHQAEARPELDCSLRSCAYSYFYRALPPG